MKKHSLEVQGAIKVTNSLATTTDILTSIATEAYMGVTCHYNEEDWKMKTFSLVTMPLDEIHTAINITGWLDGSCCKVLNFSMQSQG